MNMRNNWSVAAVVTAVTMVAVTLLSALPAEASPALSSPHVLAAHTKTIGAIVLAVLVVGGGAVYWFVIRKK